jgi:hypothetical protein
MSLHLSNRQWILGLGKFWFFLAICLFLFCISLRAEVLDSKINVFAFEPIEFNGTTIASKFSHEVLHLKPAQEKAVGLMMFSYSSRIVDGKRKWDFDFHGIVQGYGYCNLIQGRDSNTMKEFRETHPPKKAPSFKESTLGVIRLDNNNIKIAYRCIRFPRMVNGQKVYVPMGLDFDLALTRSGKLAVGKIQFWNGSGTFQYSDLVQTMKGGLKTQVNGNSHSSPVKINCVIEN